MDFSDDTDPSAGRAAVTSRAFRITVDDGRETFDAVEFSEPDNPDAYLMSDTVRSLRAMR